MMSDGEPMQPMTWWILAAVMVTAAALFLLRSPLWARPAAGPGGGVAGESKQLDAASIRGLVDALGQLVAGHYVDPQMARRLAGLLAERGRAGAYAGLADPERLAERLTADLQELSRDRHLRVVYRPGAVVKGPKIVIGRPGRGRQPQEDPGPVVEVVTEGPEEAGGGGPDVEVVVEAPGPGGAPDGGPDVEVVVEAPGPEGEAARSGGAESAPHGIAGVEVLPGNVGYLDLRELRPVPQSGAAMVAALETLAGTAAVVIDLRQNTGGGPGMVQLLASHFFGPDPVLLNTYYDRPIDRTTELWTLAEVEGPRMPEVPLFLLTSRRTFSAAESLAYTLKHHGRAKVIGEATGGGAHPSIDLPLAHGLIALVPVARSIHPVTGTDWEGVGVQPDIEVPAEQALEVALREAARSARSPSQGGA